MDFNFDWNSMAGNLPQEKTYKKFEGDTRFWKISKNEQGKGVAIIRLLPDKNKIPYVRIYGYSLKKPNPFKQGAFMWYIANSPDSINLPDPVKEKYNELMQMGTEEAKAQAKILRRNTKFFTNILVVKDPANPENNGKVFLWEFGTKMKDKIMAWQEPSDEEKMMGAKSKNLYHPLSGHNIKLAIAPQGEWSTYDSSEVMPDACSVMEGASNQEVVEFITTKTYDLNEFMQPEYYDAYDILKERFVKWWTGGSSANDSRPSTTETAPNKPMDLDMGLDDDFVETPKAKPKTTTPMPSVSSDEEDSWLDDL